MTIQTSAAVANAMLDAVEAAMGPSVILKIRTGSKPLNTSAADSGSVLATLNLPADYMSNAAGRSKAMQGSWADNAADASGTAAHYRMYAADGVTCHLQGTITATGGGGDMTVDNVLFAAGQQFTVTSFVLNDNNA